MTKNITKKQIWEVTLDTPLGEIFLVSKLTDHDVRIEVDGAGILLLQAAGGSVERVWRDD